MFTHLSPTVAASLSLLLLLASLSQAATYYISNSGNDGNPCTEAAPCQHMGKGVSMLSAGDTLYVRGGTYSGGGNNIGYPTTNPVPSGTSWSNPVTIAAYPGESVTLDTPQGIAMLGPEQYIIIDRINVLKGGFFTDNDAHHIRYQNATIDAQGHSDQPDGHANVVSGIGVFIEVINVRITGSPGYGVYWSGMDSLFDNVEIDHNCGYGMHMYHDIQGGPNPDDVERNTIRNSYIHDNDLGNCPSGGTDFGGTIVTAGENNKIYNNVFANNFAGLQLGGRCTTCEVYNNVMYGNRSVGLSIGSSSGSGGSTIRNNVQYNNATDLDNQNPPGLTFSHNWTGAQGNPQFQNAGGGNFTLQATSPLRNAGFAVPASSMPSTDKGGATRPQGSQWDIGAYEYAEGGGPPPSSGNPIYASSAASAQADCTIPETQGTPTSLTHALSCMNVPGKELRLSGTFDAVIDTLITPLTGGSSWPTATKVTSYGGGATLRLPNNTDLEAILHLRGANDSYIIFENLTLDGLSRSFGDCILLQGPGHHIRFTNLVIQNCRNHALFSFGGQDIEVLGGTWTNSLAAPLIGTFQTNNWHVEGVTLHTSSSHGINMGEGFGTDNNVLISKVTLRNLGGSGIRIAGGTGNTIRNSLITSNSGLGLQLFSGGIGAKVHYNTIVSNTGMGVQCDAGVNTAAIRANIIVGNTAGQFVNTCAAAGGSNIVTGSLATIFTNPAGGDYSLALGSPAQNSVLAGDDLPEVTDDIIGTLRPQQVVRDAGAYESLLGPVQPPAIPTVNTAAALFFF